MIEQAYRLGETWGLSVWTQDEAGPFQTMPYAGYAWQPESEPRHLPHEYIRNGTAKLLTLFHPFSGHVRVKGVTSCPNTVLHPWLKQELRAILDELPPPEGLDPESNRALWECWCAGLDQPPPLPEDLPPLRMLLIWDNAILVASFLSWLCKPPRTPPPSPRSNQRAADGPALSGLPGRGVGGVVKGAGWATAPPTITWADFMN